MTEINTEFTWKPALDVFQEGRDEGTIPVGTVFRITAGEEAHQQPLGTEVVLVDDDGSYAPEFQIQGYDVTKNPLPAFWFGYETGLAYILLANLEVRVEGN